MPKLRTHISGHLHSISRLDKRTILKIVGISALIITAVQCIYSPKLLVPFSVIDGVSVGGWRKADAAWELNHRAKNQPVNLRLGNDEPVYASPKPAQIGLSITNASRVDNENYPWYMRLVPTSILWQFMFSHPENPTYAHSESTAKTYLEKTVGSSCSFPAKNATLRAEKGELSVVSAKNGGTCDEPDALSEFAGAEPTLEKPATITLDVKKTEPAISDADAKALKAKLEKHIADGVRLKRGDETTTIPKRELISWLTFSSKHDKLSFSLSQKRAESYFADIKKQVTKSAGTQTITTKDFLVVSKKGGGDGSTLALASTLGSITSVLEGNRDTASVEIKKIPAKKVYKRSYSHTSTGISAMLKFYAHDHPGTFGVSFQELDGSKSASFDAGKRFTTASTYKLFVAYGTLKKIDAGKWKWSDKDISNGRNLSTCFDDMIEKSDNACAEALLKKLGLVDLTKQINALGLKNSGFTLGNTPLTTPSDLSLLLRKLYAGDLGLKSESRDRWISAMKKNEYRQGIPSGTSATVADKVGFLDGLLHDAAIVYSPKGDYVLVVMTDGSSWANIADITKKIEQLR